MKDVFTATGKLFDIAHRRELTDARESHARRIDALGHRALMALRVQAQIEQLQAKVVEAEDRMARYALRLEQPEMPSPKAVQATPLRARRGLGRALDVLRRPFRKGRSLPEEPTWVASARSEREKVKFEYARATREVEVYREQLRRLENEWGVTLSGLGEGVAGAILGEALTPLPGAETRAPTFEKLAGNNATSGHRLSWPFDEGER